MSNMAADIARATASAAAGAERMQAVVVAAATGRTAGAELAVGAVSGNLADASGALRRVLSAAGAGAGGLPPEVAAKVGRGLRAIGVAEAGIARGIEQAQRAGQVGRQVVGALRPAFTDFSGTLAAARQRTASLIDGAAGAARDGYATVVDRLTGRETTLPVVPTLAAPTLAVPPASVSSHPHLLILSGNDGQHFYFGLSTAAFDGLRRSTTYGVATQERLQREEALQAVHKGGESISVSGAIYTKTRAGARQLDELRRIGRRQQPLLLTTGYGEALGHYYLTKVDEEQAALMSDGAPRKQQFSLEFQRYGDDYANG